MEEKMETNGIELGVRDQDKRTHEQSQDGRGRKVMENRKRRRHMITLRTA